MYETDWSGLREVSASASGHVCLFETVLKENDELIVCIGSSQKADPLTVEERKRRIVVELKILRKENYRVVELPDLEKKEGWPLYLKNSCGLTSENENTIYRADTDAITAHLKELEGLGVKIKVVPRKRFWYKAPDNSDYELSSATEIKALHKKLSCEDLI